MKLVPLYRVRFTYPNGWGVALSSPSSTEGQHFMFAEGTCEGRIDGKFRGANHPHRRGDGTFEPDFQGVIETSDGAVIFFQLFRLWPRLSSGSPTDRGIRFSPE